MKVMGTAMVGAPLPRVWEALRDPAVLARTIPGCRSLEATGEDVYTMTVSAGVASVRGTYVGRVELTDPDPPRAFTLRARGQGAPGTVDATVRVRLSEDSGEGTRVDYDADATVGGMIGGVGQRVLGTVARKTAAEFFAAVERDLTRPAVPAPAPEAPPAVAAGPIAPMPPTVPVPPPVSPGPMLAAFLSGGAVALAGVAVGYALGRRGR
ncbi:carbon monoxide dehydrogenase subunit G [Actinomadura miaoliensis]|uniref:Carbon monoxide dehydrogenase subunit G n=1 Tax=Actinomadura miaoliensis TaxID=430685 RepID=A0ABP7WQG0_9ACTN